MFKYCKRCIGIRQFLGEPRRCDVCGGEGDGRGYVDLTINQLESLVDTDFFSLEQLLEIEKGFDNGEVRLPKLTDEQIKVLRNLKGMKE